MLYNILKHSHSGLRWLLIFSFVIAFYFLIRAAFGKKNTGAARISSLVTLILSHIQLIIGLALYFMSPYLKAILNVPGEVFMSTLMKTTTLRFFLVEHMLLMIIAIVLVTIGYSKAKKDTHVYAGARKMFFYYLIAFILMMVSIPWPFRGLGTGWF